VPVGDFCVKNVLCWNAKIFVECTKGVGNISPIWAMLRFVFSRAACKNEDVKSGVNYWRHSLSLSE
jgi:hypothetical protein